MEKYRLGKTQSIREKKNPNLNGIKLCYKIYKGVCKIKQTILNPSGSIENVEDIAK